MAALVLVVVPPQRKERIFRHQAILDGAFTDQELRQRYRFGRQSIMFLTHLLRQDLARKSRRNHALTVQQQVLSTLRFLASGSFLQVVGDTTGLDKSTVSRCVHKVCGKLACYASQAIKWPTTEECQKGKRKFFAIAGFPSIIGAVDGTHIRIQAPHTDEPSYVNRKGYHSINVQGVCDADGKFLGINASWPGCTHDAHIFRTSQVCQHMETNQNLENVLLGDSGYPCRPFLLTPYLNANCPAQRNYNYAHGRTRSVIERTFGRWKRRFHILHSEIRMQPERVVTLIMACAVLHNIAMSMREPLIDGEEDNAVDEVEGDAAYNGPQDGQAVREHVTRAYFTR
ncbi:putative nuclease HARBI1 [Pecten maximus]|uniref:putative nuclease HARBI1 n=1 Tax=Pecten maximus TaxID=6579 RepID=UPI0014584A72|nr:putative nuclease HARBI1 [Pecten maximus]